MGELAACRRFAEAALELRVPLLGRQLYTFYEHGTDLGAWRLPIDLPLPRDGPIH